MKSDCYLLSRPTSVVMELIGDEPTEGFKGSKHGYTNNGRHYDNHLKDVPWILDVDPPFLLYNFPSFLRNIN